MLKSGGDVKWGAGKWMGFAKEEEEGYPAWSLVIKPRNTNLNVMKPSYLILFVLRFMHRLLYWQSDNQPTLGWDQGSGIKDQGSGISNHGSRIKD